MPNSEYNSWYRIDNLLKSRHFSSVFDSMIIHIMGRNKIFTDTWFSLEKYYTSTSKAHIIELKLQS